MDSGIYLDNNTTTRPSSQTISKMLPFYTEMWGFPYAPYRIGDDLMPVLEESYKAIYAMLGAKETDDFVFTSSGAEAVNQVIFSTYQTVTMPTGKNQFITSHIDEAPTIMAAERLQHFGCVTKLLPADSNGQVTAKTVSEAITPRTALVSLSWANALTGVINPVGEISSLLQERGILFHLDATHILGKIFFQIEDAGAQFISFNGDNIHGPKGTGGLYIQAGVKCNPLIIGGIEQGGYRAGSINVPGLVGLASAAKETVEARDLVCTEVARLRNKLEEGIKASLPEAIIFFQDQDRIPNCSVIGFPGISNEALLFSLSKKGVYASIGGGSHQQVGLILKASGVEETLAHSSISFSLSRETTEEQIDRAINIIAETAAKLRKLSSTFHFNNREKV